jgi:hypothetical protein
MEDEIKEFQRWLRRVGTLAKDGNKQAGHVLWRAFNSLAWPLHRLEASSIDLDLLKGVLNHCSHMLSVRVSLGDRKALTDVCELAVLLCTFISEAEKHQPSLIAELKNKAYAWPALKKTPLGRSAARTRSTELAHMVYRSITLYRQLIEVARKGLGSRDTLRSWTEFKLRIDEANQFRNVLRRLPENLDRNSYPKWWRAGKEILKWYWDRHPEEYEHDLQKLARDHLAGKRKPGQKPPRTYAIELVRKSFKKVAESLSK